MDVLNKENQGPSGGGGKARCAGDDELEAMQLRAALEEVYSMAADREERLQNAEQALLSLQVQLSSLFLSSPKLTCFFMTFFPLGCYPLTGGWRAQRPRISHSRGRV